MSEQNIETTKSAEVQHDELTDSDLDQVQGGFNIGMPPSRTGNPVGGKNLEDDDAKVVATSGGGSGI